MIVILFLVLTGLLRAGRCAVRAGRAGGLADEKAERNTTANIVGGALFLILHSLWPSGEAR